jgi:hypothetical protein
MDKIIEKAVKPDVSKETLLEVVKELQEIIVGMLEIEEESNTEEDSDELKVSSTEPISKSEHIEDYESDNEEEDKWDNMEKACWSGYRQDGMKDKNGRQVPNCVPIKKSDDMEDKEEEKKSPWGGAFRPKITR